MTSGSTVGNRLISAGFSSLRTAGNQTGVDTNSTVPTDGIYCSSDEDYDFKDDRTQHAGTGERRSGRIAR